VTAVVEESSQDLLRGRAAGRWNGKAEGSAREGPVIFDGYDFAFRSLRIVYFTYFTVYFTAPSARR
jgi:hypothetical protein